MIPAKADVFIQADVGFAGCQHQLLAAVAIQIPRVGQVGQKIRGTVVVAVVVVVSVQKLVNVECAAHADGARHYIRMAECEVDGMVAAEAAAGGDQQIRSIAGANERDHFIEKIAVVFRMAVSALARRNGFVVPAFRIHGVDAKCLQLAILILAADGLDHAATLVIEEAAHRGGKYDEWNTVVAEDQ